MRIDKNKIKNILAVRNDRFGEFLLNIPALRALKQSFPGSVLTLVVDPYVRELAQCIDFVDQIITRESRRRNIGEIIKFSRELKKRKYDLCVIFNPSKEFNIISFLSGIPIRVGYSRKWSFLLTHKSEDKKYLGQRHEIEYNLELVSLAGARTEDKSLSLKISDNINNGLSQGPDVKLVAIHPWTSDPIKQWPQRHFIELTKRLADELNIKIVIIGGKDALGRGAEFYNNIGVKVINMTGKTTLVELAALLRRCKLLISGDSGPMHLACAVNTPVIAIFRNDIPGKSPKRWGPLQRHSSVIEKNNLSDISVNEVFEKAKEVIKI